MNLNIFRVVYALTRGSWKGTFRGFAQSAVAHEIELKRYETNIVEYKSKTSTKVKFWLSCIIYPIMYFLLLARMGTFTFIVCYFMTFAAALITIVAWYFFDIIKRIDGRVLSNIHFIGILVLIYVAYFRNLS
jgi:hypothetical protein